MRKEPLWSSHNLAFDVALILAIFLLQRYLAQSYKINASFSGVPFRTIWCNLHYPQKRYLTDVMQSLKTLLVQRWSIELTASGHNGSSAGSDFRFEDSLVHAQNSLWPLVCKTCCEQKPNGGKSSVLFVTSKMACPSNQPVEDLHLWWWNSFSPALSPTLGW